MKPTRQKTFDNGKLVVCETDWCGALFNKEATFSYGKWLGGTSTNFVTYGSTPPGTCPICRTVYKAPDDTSEGIIDNEPI